jgi:hypothetical protein
MPDGAAPPRWLTPTETAERLRVRPDALPRLVKQGRIPPPSYALGPRSPRYDLSALDANMAGETASTDPRTAINALAAQIARRAPRQEAARRR